MKYACVIQDKTTKTVIDVILCELNEFALYMKDEYNRTINENQIDILDQGDSIEHDKYLISAWSDLEP